MIKFYIFLNNQWQELCTSNGLGNIYGTPLLTYLFTTILKMNDEEYKSFSNSVKIKNSKNQVYNLLDFIEILKMHNWIIIEFKDIENYNKKEFKQFVTNKLGLINLIIS